MTPMPTAAAPSSLAGADARRAENLALAFQELLTVGERLRSNRQAVSDAASFRAQLMQALQVAQHEARRQGYTDTEVNLAQYAVVAFLDESILSLRSPLFADWPKRPLQEELYGHQLAGEVFFQNLQKLLGAADSQNLADVLEVHHLCLLLGFLGRYSLGNRGDLKATIDHTGERIRRIRRSVVVLSPQAALPQETLTVTRVDPWRKWIIGGSLACLALAAGTWALYKLALLPGAVSALGQVAGAR